MATAAGRDPPSARRPGAGAAGMPVAVLSPPFAPGRAKRGAHATTPVRAQPRGAARSPVPGTGPGPERVLGTRSCTRVRRRSRPYDGPVLATDPDGPGRPEPPPRKESPMARFARIVT